MNEGVKKNYIYNLLYNIFLIISPFIVTPYISRVLKPSGIGIYQYTNAVATIFILIASLGTNMYAQKEIAYYQNDIEKRSKIFKSIFIIRLISTILISLIYIPLTLTTEYRYLYLVQYILIISNLLNITWLFQGLEDFKKTATRGILVKIVSIVAIFIFVNSKDDLILYALINAIANLLSSLYLWLFLKKVIVNVKIKKEDLTKHLKPVFLLFLPVAAIYIYTYVDKIILGLLSTKEQVGFYSQSENLVKIVMTFLTSLGAVMLPRISKLIGSNKMSDVKLEVRNSIKFVIIMGLPMVLGLALTASLFVPWFFGEDYLSCIGLIKLLSSLIIIIGLSSVTGQAVLIPLNKQKEYTLSIVLGAVLNVIINIIFIPKYGAVGASIGTLAAEIVVNIVQQLIVFKLIDIKIVELIKDNYKAVLASIIMAIVLFMIKPLFNPTIINTFIYITIGIITYILILLILKEKFIFKIIKR